MTDILLVEMKEQGNLYKETKYWIRSSRLSSNGHCTDWKWETAQLLCSLLVLLFLLPASGHAQTEEIFIPTENFFIRAKLWTEKDGIPHWAMSRPLFQDSRGFLWGEWKGTFCRFDGRSFRKIRHRDLGLHEFPIVYLGEDVHGNIWKTRSNRFDAGEIEVYVPTEDSLYSLEAYLGGQAKALEFSGDTLGLYSLDRQIYIVDEGAGRMWRYDGALKEIGAAAPAPPNQAGRSWYLPAPDQGKWHISETDGVRLIDAQGRTQKHYPQLHGTEGSFSFTRDFRLRLHKPNGEVHCLFRDRGDNEEAAPVFTPAYFPFLEQKYPLSRLKGYQLEYMPPYSIQLAANGKPASENLLPILVSAFSSHLEPPLPHGIFPSALIPLHDGSFILHIGGTITPHLLLVEFQPRHFRAIWQKENIISLACLNDKLFAVKDYYDFSVFDLTAQTERTDYDSPLGNAFLQTQADQLWYFGMTAGIGTIPATPPYSPRRRSPYPIGSPAQEQHNSLLRLSDSLLWCATTLGVKALDLNTMAQQYVLQGAFVYYLYQDRQGEIWACTDRGIYSFAKQRYYLDTLPDGRRIVVAHVYEQDPITFWLATRQGLIRWKPYSDEYQLFTKADGLSDNIVHGIYADQHGRLWLSTNHGITAFDPGSGQFSSWFASDGLAYNEQNTAAHAQGKDGRLYFGSLSGVTMFYPDSIPKPSDTLKQAPIINEMVLFNKHGAKLGEKLFFPPPQEPYRLPRACRQLSLAFSLPYYGYDDLIVEWRIEKNNVEWQQLGDDDKLFLLQIPYGVFQLEFRARVKDTPKILGSYLLEFYAPYPVYFSPFFWLFSFAGVIALTALFFHWRSRQIKAHNLALQAEVKKRTRELEVQTRKLEQVDAAKTQLFNNISHELRTPLNLIQLSAEQLLGRQAPEQEQLAGQIKGQVRHITRMLEEIMDLSRMEMGLVKVESQIVEWQSFINQSFRMLESLAQHKQQDYQLQLLPAGEGYLHIDNYKVSRILSNLISNAIKYTPPGGRILVRS
ncbi:MAG: hypothetical protein KDC75_17875, partial [Phaeodactylibacter sp.]|nr:hypothetical protein [Phaeodactylibacter sp.]